MAIPTFEQIVSGGVGFRCRAKRTVLDASGNWRELSFSWEGVSNGVTPSDYAASAETVKGHEVRASERGLVKGDGQSFLVTGKAVSPVIAGEGRGSQGAEVNRQQKRKRNRKAITPATDRNGALPEGTGASLT